MTTTELEKPDKASSTVTIWNTNNAINAHKATISERTFPFTKKMVAMIKIIMVVIINTLFTRFKHKCKKYEE